MEEVEIILNHLEILVDLVVDLVEIWLQHGIGNTRDSHVVTNQWSIWFNQYGNNGGFKVLEVLYNRLEVVVLVVLAVTVSQVVDPMQEDDGGAGQPFAISNGPQHGGPGGDPLRDIMVVEEVAWWF